MFGGKGGFGSSSSKQDNDQTFDVYVARIPTSFDEAKLMDLFSSIGKVKGVIIKPGKGEYTSNYAFIKFTTEEDALCAVRYMNNSQVESGTLLVSYRKKDGQGSGSEGGGFGSTGFQRQTSNEKSATRGGFTANRGRGGFGAGRGGSTSFTGFNQNNQGLQKDNNSMNNGFQKAEEDDLWDDEAHSSQTSVVPSSPKEKVAQQEKVLVTHVGHPTKLWGQAIVREVANAIELIIDALQTDCPNMPAVSGQIPYGKVFGCTFSEDQLWYRCKVEKQLPELGQKVMVRYIDYGNCEVVDQGKLVILPASLSQQPPCAKEYDLKIKPVYADEASIKFKQGVEFLKVMAQDKVVRLETITGANPTVVAYVDKSNQDIVKEIVAAGYATVAEKPKSNEERPSFTKPTAAAQAIRPPRGANSFQMSRENQELKSKIDTIQSEVQMLKQQRSRLQSDLEESESKSSSKSLMTKRFGLLTEEVAALKKLRDEMHLDEGLSALLKQAVDLMSNKEHSINLENMSPYQELLGAENEMRDHQLNVKSCSEKEALEELVVKRDDSRRSLLNKMDEFLQFSNKLPFETRQKELEFVLSEIRKKYVLPASTTETTSVDQAVQAYEDWRLKKIDNVKELQSVADNCSSNLINCLDSVKQKVNLSYQPMLIDIELNVAPSNEDVDEFIDSYSKAIASEIAQIKESNINTEAKHMVTNLVVSLVSSINAELSDIKKLREELLQSYEKKKEDISHWLHKLPDVSKLKRIKNSLKSLKSTFRHKQADRRDFEEDPDEKEQLVQTEKELEFIRNDLHAVFVEQHKLLEDLSCIAATHFPELPVQHSDLGISVFLETNGLVRSREIEHYDHHALPLLSSATKQPVVFKTKFNQLPCVLKEYSLNDRCTKDRLKSSMIIYAKCNHENLTALDGLFFDKGGRKAYLQTTFYNGGNLSEFIKTKPDTKELYKLLHGVLKGIACLHKNNIVHGSVSPRSVFINKYEDGQVFAILEEPNFAKDEVERFKDLATFSSSNSYPFINAESELPSTHFDVYCFGLLMLWAYFPDAVFSGNTQSMLTNIVKENPVGDLLECLLNKVPSLRMTADDALMHAFFENAEERSQTPSEELLNTMKDLNESYVHIESASHLDNQPDQAPAEVQETEEEPSELVKENGDAEQPLEAIINCESSEPSSGETEQKTEDVKCENPTDSQNESPETFSEEWKN